MLAGASEVFNQGRGRKIQEEAVEQDKERLERKIGQLVVEVDWLSKKCKELGIDP
jgi:transposase